MIIHGVRFEDKDTFLNLAKKFHAESYHAQSSFNESKILRYMALSSNPENNIFIAYDKREDGAIMGFVAGVLVEQPFSNTTVVQDLGLYVIPEKRGSSLGIRLIHLLEDWSKHKEASCTIIYHNTGIGTEKSIPLFQRLGYLLRGHIFVKENK